MSLCEVRPQALQQIGGFISEEKLAIVPDIHSYNLVGSLQGCKRFINDSDNLSFEELLNGDSQQQLCSFSSSPSPSSFPESKRHCSGYEFSPSPEQFQNSEVFAPDLEVKESYDFGAGKDSSIFTQCGGNSPARSSPFTATPTSNQTTAGCQQPFDIQGLDFFPNMQHQSLSVVPSHQVAPAQAENYKLVITEQPEEVSM